MSTRQREDAQRAATIAGCRHQQRCRRIATIVFVAICMLGVADRAQADTLHVSHVEYDHGSAALEATVTASGPRDTDIALGLARERCPARPEEPEVQPGITADGQPHTLQAINPPTLAAGRGPVQLCVWTIHLDGAIGAHYEEQEMLPAPPRQSLNPLATSNHPWWWVPLGWGAIVAFLTAVGVFLYVLRRGVRFGHRRVRQRFRSQEDPETLSEWQQAAADAATAPPGTAAPAAPTVATAPAAENEPTTLEMDAIRPEDLDRAAAAHAAPASTSGEHPFIAPEADQPAADAEAEASVDAPDSDTGAVAHEQAAARDAEPPTPAPNAPETTTTPDAGDESKPAEQNS